MSATRSNSRRLLLSVLLGASVLLVNPALALQPFPLSANQRGMVFCLERTSVYYDVYLPPGYSTTNNPRPILYTFHPNGGGMVGYFQAVCASMNIILVGMTNSANGVPWDTVIKEFFAVTRDIRQRVLFDPTAVFASGFSGGGENCYFFSRFGCQHVAGIMPIAGWLGRQAGVNDYQTIDRVQTNLLVARITGDSDHDAIYFLAPDSNYLATCGAVIADWYYPGGHNISFPDDVKSSALSWMLSLRVPSGPNDQTNATTQANQWRLRAATGQREAVVRECVAALMQHPRTWTGLQAQLVLDDQMLSYGLLRPLTVDNLAQGDFAFDHFYYFGHGAAVGTDLGRYFSSMKLLTGVTGASGDRAGDIRALLLQFPFVAPVFQCSRDQNPGSMKCTVVKDAPGFGYSLQTRSNLANDVWQDASFPAVETEARWSVTLDVGSGAPQGFFRLHSYIAPGSSPPWP